MSKERTINAEALDGVLYAVKVMHTIWGLYSTRERAEWEAEGFREASGLEFYVEPITTH